MDMLFVIKCREDGMTYAAIADKFGVSRQAVHQAVYRYKNFKVKETTCIYPGLRNWMNKYKVRIGRFALMCNGVCDLTMRDYLKGRHDIPKTVIDKILRVTGLTYEEAFGVNETMG